MRSIILIALFLALLDQSLYAHGGGLDGLGCHYDRRRGGYHCHRGPLAGQSFASKEEAEKKLKSMREEKPAQPPSR